MIAARIARRLAPAQTEQRDLVGRLLLTGIGYTDARHGLTFAAMGAVYLVYVLLEQLP